MQIQASVYSKIQPHHSMNTVKLTPRFTLAGITAILLWSTTIAFSRSLTEQLGTFTTAFWIYSLAGILGIAAAEIQSRGTVWRMLRLNPAYLWGCGGLFVFYITALYLAVGMSNNHAQVLAVGLINYLWPGFSLVFSIIIFRRKAHPWLPIGLVMALAGVWVAMLSGESGLELTLQSLLSAGSLAPFLLAFGAAVAWGLYTNLSRKWASEDDTGAVPLFLLSSGLVVGILKLFSPETTLWSTRAFLELGYMAFFPAMLAYVLWDIAVRKGNLTLVASLSYLTPLLSTLTSALVLKVTPSMTLWSGALLVMVGAVICKFSLPDES